MSSAISGLVKGAEDVGSDAAKVEEKDKSGKSFSDHLGDVGNGLGAASSAGTLYKDAEGTSGSGSSSGSSSASSQEDKLEESQEKESMVSSMYQSMESSTSGSSQALDGGSYS